MSFMFYYCDNLKSLDLSNFDTSNVTNMSYMFYSCSNLKSLNLSNFDTSNVTNMSLMFYSCSNLKSLNLSNFDTSNVTNMSVMFYWNNSLKSLILDWWDLSQSTNWSSIISSMFNGATSLEKVSMRNWTIPETFTHAVWCRTSSLCAELDELDVSGWNLSKTTNLNWLFWDSKAKEISDRIRFK